VVRFGVGDHARLIPDPDRFHHCREWLRRQEQVPNPSLIRPAQITLPIEMNGSRKMSLLVESLARPIASPAGIHDAYVAI